MATITDSTSSSEDLDEAIKKPGGLLKVSAKELENIRSIMENPEPPSEKMKAVWADYLRYAAEHPNSNW